VLGHFVNTIVVVADTDPDLGFDALLERTRATMLRVLDHADYPFPLLVERLRPARDPSRSPLFQVMFNWNQRRQAGTADDEPPVGHAHAIVSVVRDGVGRGAPLW